MPGNHRLPAITTLLLIGAALAGLAPAATANPCNPGCGTVTADPVVSSSTAQGESSSTITQWEHCLYTKSPSSTTCETATGAVYAGTITGPSAGCAKGVLRANGQVVDETLWIC